MSLNVKSIVVGPIQTTCYVIWDESTGAGAVIDPGGQLEDIKQMVDESGCKIEWILLTHGHFDHVFYAGDLAELYDAKVGMSPADITLIGDTLEIAEMYYDMDSYSPVMPSDLLNDGDTIQLGSTTITVISTPGHSLGGLCFMADNKVFCGDTIFAGGIGRTDFTGGSYEQLEESISQKIYSLDDDIVLYPGHGPSTTVGREKKTNPYIRI